MQRSCSLFKNVLRCNLGTNYHCSSDTTLKNNAHPLTVSRTELNGRYCLKKIASFSEGCTCGETPLMTSLNRSHSGNPSEERPLSYAGKSEAIGSAGRWLCSVELTLKLQSFRQDDIQHRECSSHL